MESRSVVVKLLPAKADSNSERAFQQELLCSIVADRPRIVLDGSDVHVIDKATVGLLLWSLEEAMKRNGDVKLAALPSDSEAVLDAFGVSRLFAIYDTAASASASYQLPPVSQRA